MSDFSINIKKNVNKNIEYERTKIKPWGIPVKISIHSLITDPIFTLCFQFDK